MENGPVDAGPIGDGEYDGAAAGTYSPDQSRRADSRKRTGFRSASAHRSIAHEGSPNGRAEAATTPNTRERAVNRDFWRVRSEQHYRSASASASSSARDPPTYARVGATVEEATGEVCPDSEDIMKQDPDEPDVRDDEARPHRMFKFTLYETNARYWITGGDITDKYFRLLRIDRTSPPGQIALFEDDTVYNRREMNDTLNAIDQGNKATGGLRMKYSFWGLLGFIRFTEAFYMLIITKRKQAAMIGGHYVYQVEATEMVPLTTGSSSSFTQNRNKEEARFLGILSNLDLSKSFYFSYSYDITNSLQNNIVRQRQAISEGRYHAAHDYNGMFVWNHHLLKSAVSALTHPYDWCLPIVHGFLDQAGLDIFGRTIYVTIIGRRSRFFAGARFLKRGVNDLGYVANDVETEQIVAEKLTTSFHAPGPRLYSNPTYTSYVHHRGSIPLYWTQDNSTVTPKPDININLSDPFYQPAAMHFDNLFERYGCQVYVLNLVKAKEKVPRESKLLHAFLECIYYLNQSLPEDKRILYKAYDMARAAKTRNANVIGGLEVIAKEIVEKTGFFHNGQVVHQEAQVQNGIARTNCIDCLDRTNAAQFVIGKHAFALQLKKLGVISGEEVAYDTDAVRLFTEMFHDHGDNIAMQYGGSHLVNTMATYRKLNQWHSSSRDMVESFKRYYHNSFTDSQRQDAYNLFLGNYIWAQGQPMLWDLPTDYYLHHSDPRAWLERHRRHYIDWYSPANLEARSMPALTAQERDAMRTRSVGEFDDYWRECYRPNTLSSLQKVYSYKMNSTQRYLAERSSHVEAYDFSPFVRRIDTQMGGSPVKKSSTVPPPPPPHRKGVKIVDPRDEDGEKSLHRRSHSPPNHHPEPGSHRPPTATNEEKPSILREHKSPPRPLNSGSSKEVKPLDKSSQHTWTLQQFHEQALHPSVSPAETAEYAHYVAHPLNLPLVGTVERGDAVVDAAFRVYVEYLARGQLQDEEEDEEEVDVGVYADYVAAGRRADGLGDGTGEAEGETKRYRMYRQWLRGRSLFRQNEGEGGGGGVGEG